MRIVASQRLADGSVLADVDAGGIVLWVRLASNGAGAVNAEVRECLGFASQDAADSFCETLAVTLNDYVAAHHQGGKAVLN